MSINTIFIGTHTNTSLTAKVAVNGGNATIVVINGADHTVTTNGEVMFLQHTVTGAIRPVTSDIAARLANVDIFFSTLQTVRTDEAIEAEDDVLDIDFNTAF